MSGITEDQAREKWCHQSMGGIRRGDSEISGVIREVAPCSASECMAWRWSRAKETKAFLSAVQEYMKASKKDFNQATQAVFAESGNLFDQAEGYCGLAGKPE